MRTCACVDSFFERWRNMLRAKNVDITGGPILKSIVIYAIPIIIGTLIQQLFNAADLMVLFRSSTGPILYVVNNSLITR